MKFKCKIKNNDINSYNITKMHTDFQNLGLVRFLNVIEVVHAHQTLQRVIL